MGSEPREITANAGVLGGALMCAFALVALWGAWGGSTEVWLFPRLAASVALGSGVVLIGIGLSQKDRTVLWQAPEMARDVGLFILAVAAYVAALGALGFWLVTGIMVGGGAFGLGGSHTFRRLVGLLVVGMVVGLALDALFVGAFGVPLPGGWVWAGARWRWWAP